MIDPKMLSQLARHPKQMIDFQMTGKLPKFAEPSSPLITLLLSIPPAERRLITAVKVGQRLGYTSQNTFQNVSQALNWLKPSYSAESYPSQSHQDKRFNRVLTIDDLAQCANVPEMIRESWWRSNPRVRRREQDTGPTL